MKNEFTEFGQKPTIYESKADILKGNILYFHGGGLIFGTKDDLPLYHINEITKAGYNIIAFDYPLAPESNFNQIIDYIIKSINIYTENLNEPYFLWGRSAGAYLSLLVANSKELKVMPKAIISYYGYGLLVPHWFNKPSAYYTKYPMVEKKIAENLIQNEVILSAPPNPRFLLYLYARQSGAWMKLIWGEDDENKFLEKYSLRNVDFSHYPPVLLAHSKEDNDVPYEESEILSQKIKNSTFIPIDAKVHDFDRDDKSRNTKILVGKTIEFLDCNF